MDFADNHDEEIFSDMDPVAFMEEKILQHYRRIRKSNSRSYT